MKSLSSADCRLPMGVFSDFLGNSEQPEFPQQQLGSYWGISAVARQ